MRTIALGYRRRPNDHPWQLRTLYFVVCRAAIRYNSPRVGSLVVVPKNAVSDVAVFKVLGEIGV